MPLFTLLLPPPLPVMMLPSAVAVPAVAAASAAVAAANSKLSHGGSVSGLPWVLVDVDGLAHEGKWWSWGHAFTNASGGEGLGATNPTPSTTAGLWAVLGC